MSTRSLIEIDHDRISSIENDPETFVNTLLAYLRNPHSEKLSDGELWRHYGVTIFGERHHTAPFHIQWGYTHKHNY